MLQLNPLWGAVNTQGWQPATTESELQGSCPVTFILASQTPKRSCARVGACLPPPCAGSGLGEQGDQQALHVEDAGGGAQAGPCRTGGQEEKLPLSAERVQGQLLPQLCCTQGIALILRGREVAAQEGSSTGSSAAGWQGALSCLCGPGSNRAQAGLPRSCIRVALAQANEKQHQACTWLPAWEIYFLWGILQAAAWVLF